MSKRCLKKVHVKNLNIKYKKDIVSYVKQKLIKGRSIECGTETNKSYSIFPMAKSKRKKLYYPMLKCKKNITI